MPAPHNDRQSTPMLQPTSRCLWCKDTTPSRPFLDLALRLFLHTALALIVPAIAFSQTPVAESQHAHTDVEFRLGAGSVCGTCLDNDEGLPKTIKTTAQIFVDRLFPIAAIGDGVIEIGPYAKGALLDGMNVPLIAGGVIVGYRLGPYEILVNGGFAYATERIGEAAPDRLGQTQHTYDLGFALRYDINQYFISAGYQHNSNGASFGLNPIQGKGTNPGYDNAFVGVGIRFDR